MSSYGKSINLYLMDGTASGRCQATLSNWNGVAYRIPRSDLKKCEDIPNLQKPGVYFLFGRDDESAKKFIYVGKAENVLKQIGQSHIFKQPQGSDKTSSYWTEAVIFVTSDNTLEQGRVNYLENRFYTIAKEANRYFVKNGNTSTQSQLEESVRDLLEEFIDNVKLVLPILGFSALEPLASKTEIESADDLLYFNRSNGKATGKINGEGFWVLKGSYIDPKLADYIPKNIKEIRKNVEIDSNGILQEDVCFGSPSSAAEFVCGRGANGLKEWKNKDGISLKKLDSELATSSSSNASNNSKEKSNDITKQPMSEKLHIASKKIRAFGFLCENGFVVTKGSEFSSTEAKSCPQGIKKLRALMKSSNKIKNGKFAEDVQFSSPSAASSCVCGSSTNGKIMWKYPNGETIKDRESKK